MPSACAEAAALDDGATPVAGVTTSCAASAGAIAALGLGGSGVCGHAASARVRARTGRSGGIGKGGGQRGLSSGGSTLQKDHTYLLMGQISQISSVRYLVPCVVFAPTTLSERT